MPDPELSRRLARVVRWLGLGVAAASLVFVAERIWASRAFFSSEHLGPALVAAVALGMVGYAGASLLLALAWRRSLLRFSARDAGTRACIAVYGRTQIAKYVPGNVFHWVGRHALARRLGYPDDALAWAALNEAVVVSLAAGGIALAAVALRGDAALAPLPALVALVAALAVASALIDPLVARVAALRGTAPERLSGGPAAVAGPLLQVTGFMAASGALLLGLATAVSGSDAIAAAGVVISGTAVSWLAGFVVPGASAGAGVREAVLILWLEPVLGTAASTTLALAWRLVTVGGDALFFATTLPLSAGPAGR